MKKRNIAAAILLASMMAVSTCAVSSMTASAASSIAVDKAAETGNTYKAYQLLKGTQTASNELTNVTFGDNLPVDTDADTGNKTLTSGLVTALRACDATVFASLTVNTTPTEFATMISNLTTDAQKQKFAKVIGKSVTGTGTEVTTTATTVAEGYYIVKEQGTGTPKTLNLLKVAGEVTLTVKEGTPTSAKTVADMNDSKTETGTNTKTADYDIGDHVPYTLTFTLPSDYAAYEKYPVTFWDDMGAGLTLDAESVKIWYGDTDTSTGGTTITFETGTPTTAFDNPTGGTIYKYEIGDLKTAASSMTAGQTITIKYTATLNNNAVIGGTGNPNNYKVSYANDPNWTATPGPGETPPPSTPPTGDTPEDKNVVFTYQLTVNKVDDDGNSLVGANFTLYKWTDTTNIATVDATSGWTQKQEITATDISTFEFKGLDDGVYKLVESKKPSDAYNQIAPIMFEITATHNDATYDLGTVSQTGFDKASVSGGVISVNIQNNKGMTLPSTGGIGTTIFYVVGGTLVAGAVVLLITKKRMSINDQK